MGKLLCCYEKLTTLERKFILICCWKEAEFSFDAYIATDSTHLSVQYDIQEILEFFIAIA